MTYNEIKDFIKTNNIEKRIDLQRNYKEVFRYFKKLSKEEKIYYYLLNLVKNITMAHHLVL